MTFTQAAFLGMGLILAYGVGMAVAAYLQIRHDEKKRRGH